MWIRFFLIHEHGFIIAGLLRSAESCVCFMWYVTFFVESFYFVYSFICRVFSICAFCLCENLDFNFNDYLSFNAQTLKLQCIQRMNVQNYQILEVWNYSPTCFTCKSLLNLLLHTAEYFNKKTHAFSFKENYSYRKPKN